MQMCLEYCVQCLGPKCTHLIVLIVHSIWDQAFEVCLYLSTVDSGCLRPFEGGLIETDLTRGWK